MDFITSEPAILPALKVSCLLVTTYLRCPKRIETEENSPVGDKGRGAHYSSLGTTGSVGRDESPSREERENKAVLKMVSKVLG